MSNSQQLFGSGQAHGHGEAKADEWAHSAKSATNTACAKAQGAADTVCDKTANNAQSAHEGKEKAAGFIQQTGEQVIDMAKGAAETVKNTVGLGDSNTKR